VDGVKTVYRKRLLTEDEATKMVGGIVPDIEPDITEACIVIDPDTDEVVLMYLPLEAAVVKSARNAVLGIKQWGSAGRTGGWDSAARTFGLAPRKPFHGRESCRPTVLASEQPAEHAKLVALAEPLKAMLQAALPQVWTEDNAVMTAEVTPEWRMLPDSNWTSGVVNRTAELPYHRDAFNFDVWSAMPVVRRGVRGGHLSVPEYGATVACRDGWAVFFPGYKYVHGVTPIKQVDKDGYRYSIVFYALKGMKDCFTHAVETAKGREKRTQREQELAEAVEGKRAFKVGKG
jgi:hypothetical protein